MDIELFDQAPIYLKISIVALVTALSVEAVKIWLKKFVGAWWYKGTVILCAFAFAVFWSVLARYINLIAIDGPVVGLAVIQSVIIAALATGGYEQITKLWDFAGSGLKAVQQARSIDTQVNIDTIEGGDTISVGDIEESEAVSIGKEADSDIGNK